MNNRGYQGLFAGVDKNQQAKDNLIVAEQLSNFSDKKRKEEQENQAQMAAIQDQIRKETSQLLGHDKKAIQQRARDMYSLVRTQLAANGGNYTAFMNNGGRALIDTYKNGVLNSNEMADYTDNQKNMATILEMQKKGLGHLVNNIDRQSMLDYQRNKGGKISFTGTLSDIDMPDLQNYDWGTDIPAIEILKNGKNKLAIMNNYALNHPDLPQPPSDAALIAYVKENYRGRGANWQKGADERKQSYTEFSGNRSFEQGQYEFEATRQDSKDQFKQNLEYQYASLEASKMSGSGKGGKETLSESEQLLKDASEQSIIADATYIASEMNNGGEGVSIEKFVQGGFNNQFFDPKNGSLNGVASSVSAVPYTTTSASPTFFTGSGLLDSFGREVLSDKWRPTNAMKLNGLNGTAAMKSLLDDRYEIKGGMIKGVQIAKHGNWFAANGEKVADAKGVFHNHVSGEGKAARDFKIEGVVQVGVANSGGKEFIITDRMKNGKADPNWNYKKRGEGGKVKLKQMVAIKNSGSGEIFYVPFDLGNSSLASTYQNLAGAADNITTQQKTIRNTYKKNEYAKNTKKNEVKIDNEIFTSFKNNKEAMNNFRTRAKISSGGNVGLRTPVYFALASGAAFASQDTAMFEQLSNSSFLEDSLDNIKKRNPNLPGREILSNRGYTNKAVIEHLIKYAEDEDDKRIFQTAYEHLNKI